MNELVFDPTVRNQIDVTLQAVAKLLPELSPSKTTLELVDAYCQVLIVEHRADVAGEVRAAIGGELSTAHFGALIAGLMAIAFLQPQSQVIPSDWINPGGSPNPNSVVAIMLANLSNYALGVTCLIQAGLEAQARTNLRTMLELAWLILTTTADRLTLAAYAEAVDDETERSRFREFFSAGRLMAKLTEIEALLGLPQDVTNVLTSIRSQQYSMYSKSTHSAYAGTFIGALGYTYDNNETFRLNLFGRADRASYATLYHMNDALFVFFAMFRRSLERLHHLRAPYEASWQEILALHEAFGQVVRNREMPEWAPQE